MGHFWFSVDEPGLRVSTGAPLCSIRTSSMRQSCQLGLSKAVRRVSYVRIVRADALSMLARVH